MSDWSDAGLPPPESDISSSFKHGSLAFRPMLGPIMTRPVIQHPDILEFTIRLDGAGRDQLLSFWQERGGGVFTFPHPLYGDIDCQFPAASPPEIVHIDGGWYDAKIALEALT